MLSPSIQFCSRRPPHRETTHVTPPLQSPGYQVHLSVPIFLLPVGPSSQVPSQSILAFLMLMEVSTPGRTLKPPSSIKAGSSCPCTITLAPVTVDSRGMKSFCSVRSVRDRPEDAGGEELGMETHLSPLQSPTSPGGTRPVSKPLR